jgi:hypothetical protein
MIATLLTCAMAAPTATLESVPPNYPRSTECQTIAHVTLCAINRLSGGNPRLKIDYAATGPLSASKTLKAYVKLNGRGTDSVGTMLSVLHKPISTYYFAGWTRVFECYQATVGDPITSSGPNPKYLRCPVNELFPLLPGGPGEGRIGYYWDPAPKAESDLIAKAQGQDWYVDLSFHDEQGNWDSKFGADYRFSFL